MSGSLIDNVSEHVKGFMQGASKELSKMQSAPIGMKPRSPQEKKKIWNTIMAIPDPQDRNDIMTEMASMAGHKGDKFDSCDWCKFVRENLDTKEIVGNS